MKILLNVFFALSMVATVSPANARDGKAWGGQCIVMKGGAVNSASCGSEGVSCTGNGRGGVDCSWNGIAGTYEDKLGVKESVKKMKISPAAKPVLKQSKETMSIKN
jgi:hypothetical protein